MAAQVILPCLSAFVFYAIFYFAEINGLHGLAVESLTSRTLPGTNEPLRTDYTGIETLDGLLTVLTVFFWPAVDGSNPSLTLHSIAFAGTFGSAWILVVLEAWRQGNSWSLTAFASVFGLTAQVLTFAFAAPLYAAIQLYGSITASRPSAENIRVPRAVLNAMPFAFVVGYMVPTVLLILPPSEYITADLKQVFIAGWHPWPAYVSILITAIYVLSSPFLKDERSPSSSRAALRSLRVVYAFAFAQTAVAHLTALIISLATVLAPVIFKEQFLGSLHPLQVFETRLPWSSPAFQVETVGQGVQVFLRWDYLIGSTGILVWALTLHTTAHQAVYSRVCLAGLGVKIVLLTLLAGPVGAAVELMWERDELVLSETGSSKETAQKQLS